MAILMIPLREIFFKSSVSMDQRPPSPLGVPTPVQKSQPFFAANVLGLCVLARHAADDLFGFVGSQQAFWIFLGSQQSREPGGIVPH